MPWHARLGNDLVAAIMSIRTGRRVHDLPPFKALRAPILTRLELSDAGYGWTTQLVGRVIAEPTIRFREMPVRFRARQGGTSKVSGSWRASVAAGRAMVGRAWSETTTRPLLGLMAKAPGPGGPRRVSLPSSATRPPRHSGPPACPMPPTARSEASRTARLAPIAMLPSIADVDAVVRIIGPAWTPIVQTRPGLAAALVDVFLAAFDRGADRALAVAGDAPGLPPARIEAAMAVLARGPHGAVLGPAEDGGYHLVGARWRQVPRQPRRRSGVGFGATWRAGCGERSPRAHPAIRPPSTPPGVVSSRPAGRLPPSSRGRMSTRCRIFGAWRCCWTADGRWAPRTAEWLRRNRASVEGG